MLDIFSLFKTVDIDQIQLRFYFSSVPYTYTCVLIVDQTKDDKMEKHPGIGKTVLAANHQTNYLEQGEGKPLFLLHGSGPGVSAWTNWSKVMPDLAGNFRVIAPDIAGFGFTEFKADSKYDIELWVGHLTGIMDALGIEKASFVGNSFGGALSIGLALFAPQRVDKLVLLGTPAGEFVQTPGLRSAWEYEPSMENMEKTMRLFPYNQAIITEEMIRTRYEASARPGAQDALRKLLPKPNAGTRPCAASSNVRSRSPSTRASS